MNAEDIERLLHDLGLRKVHIRSSRPDEVLACCPFHDDENPSLAVSTVKDGFPGNCFAECWRGDLVSLVQRVLDLSRSDAIRYARRYGELELAHKPLEAITLDSVRRDAAKRQLDWEIRATFYRRALKKIRRRDARLLDEFLADDGRKLELQPSRSLGWDAKKKALVFVWYDASGRVVGLSGRQVVPPEHKFYYPGFATPGDALFLATPGTSFSTLHVHEGPLDALATWWATRLHSAAIGRAAPTASQSSIIAQLTDRVVLVLDRDKGGERGTDVAFKRLSSAVRVSSARTHLLGKDASRTYPATLRRVLTPC